MNLGPLRKLQNWHPFDQILNYLCLFTHSQSIGKPKARYGWNQREFLTFKNFKFLIFRIDAKSVILTLLYHENQNFSFSVNTPKIALIMSNEAQIRFCRQKYPINMLRKFFLKIRVPIWNCQSRLHTNTNANPELWVTLAPSM